MVVCDSAGRGMLVMTRVSCPSSPVQSMIGHLTEIKLFSTRTNITYQPFTTSTRSTKPITMALPKEALNGFTPSEIEFIAENILITIVVCDQLLGKCALSQTANLPHVSIQ
jgi:hypothetical protein